MLRWCSCLSYGQPRLSFYSSLSNIYEHEFVQYWGHHTHYQITHPHTQLSRKKNNPKNYSFGTSFPLLKHYRFGVEIPWQELLFPFCMFLRKVVKKVSGDEPWCARAAASPRTRSNSLNVTPACVKVGATMGTALRCLMLLNQSQLCSPNLLNGDALRLQGRKRCSVVL